MQSDPLAQLVNCEKLKKNSEMENKKTHPFVTIYCDIVEDSDGDATQNLVTPTQQSPSLTPTDDREETIEPYQSSSPDEKVSTHIFKSIQAQSTQEITHITQVSPVDVQKMSTSDIGPILWMSS